MHHLELAKISKSFGETRAVHDLSLHVERGEILSILGPSGCGKTTTLRMIAGLEIPSAGSILSNGGDITKVPARARNMGMVFQNYALFPHLNVFENIAFGLKTRRLADHVISQRVKRALENVRMADYERRPVHELSGGQQQRIALARALAIEPAVLLLDEPLSNLDPSLREDLRDQIRNVIRELAVTTVFVTHDQQEAFALADRVAIMNAGICRQTGKPEEVYNRPADTFIAGFLGKANLLPGKLMGLDEKVVAMVRPENVIVSMRDFSALTEVSASTSEGGSDGVVKTFSAIVTKAIFEGPLVSYSLDLGGVPITSRAFHHGKPPFQPGTSVNVSITSNRIHLLSAP